jgi:catechol 2,3-dioxygenase-like lactoylglutathione lyase family enzyme
MWYARPVLHVADTARAAAFYRDKLGFTEAWHHTQGGTTLVVQVERDGCELILSQQWREKVGKGMLFISLTQAGFAALPGDCERNGIDLQKGWWGYRCLIVSDPDGNQLFFPAPDDKGEPEDQEE